MYLNEKILVGKTKDGKELSILLEKANRHGIITGASGTGKTITLKVMAESFSAAGVPVFLADVKGDLAGTAKKGEPSEALDKRIAALKIPEFDYDEYPVQFWDLYQEKGIALRASIFDVGPQILSIMLGLSEAQEGVLTIVYKIAEEEGHMIYDISDLKLLLQYVGDHRQEYTLKYGNITTQSIGVIQRSLLALEKQGADKFFGLPALNINDFLKTNSDGKGYINILDAVQLFNSPDLYASFLLWLLTKLFNEMPEVGDLDKPKMVYFFDEAHLLFNGMPAYRLKQITQIVKLIRSRGIGLYFISQSPTDIPDEVSAQLGNRVQHNLRAYTPTELKAVKAAANSFRENPKFNTEEAIKELGTGEALISFQNEKGEPEVVEKATILPPQSKMGVLDDLERNKIINNSELNNTYHEKEEKEDAAHITIAKIIEEENKKKQEAEDKKAKELQEKEEKKKQQEEEKEKAKAEREAEKEKKSSIGYKIKTKAENKIINRVLTKIVSFFEKAITKGLKSESKKATKNLSKSSSKGSKDV